MRFVNRSPSCSIILVNCFLWQLMYSLAKIRSSHALQLRAITWVARDVRLAKWLSIDCRFVQIKMVSNLNLNEHWQGRHCLNGNPKMIKVFGRNVERQDVMGDNCLRMMSKPGNGETFGKRSESCLSLLNLGLPFLPIPVLVGKSTTRTTLGCWAQCSCSGHTPFGTVSILQAHWALSYASIGAIIEAANGREEMPSKQVRMLLGESERHLVTWTGLRCDNGM